MNPDLQTCSHLYPRHWSPDPMVWQEILAARKRTRRAKNYRRCSR